MEKVHIGTMVTKYWELVLPKIWVGQHHHHHCHGILDMVVETSNRKRPTYFLNKVPQNLNPI